MSNTVRHRLPPAKRLALLVFIVVPALAWAVVRPVRVLLPRVGTTVTCVDASICVDDPERTDDAKAVYAEAVTFVSRRFGAVEGEPKVVFCSTQVCADHFGLGKRSAVTLGTLGTVVGPRAWKSYYVRHELIHYEQFKHLGLLRVLRSPSWLVEGMAYGLSEDPRKPLAEPFESWRKEFLAW
jgi:hypothetical protein